ncbi:hypothetical protein QFW77_13380 [Luteimonas sp. RD2P54]|uniref:Lipoprotein n=1 Tax=Luteimonas endophytica TaxID=3042023 RepID=A0ABT6JBL4_9GAMM|nr:hypothetical protein [Luteimonas endophytica]MDH5823970.1 hypothetical protein [Luteimonas endophytica]
MTRAWTTVLGCCLSMLLLGACAPDASDAGAGAAGDRPGTAAPGSGIAAKGLDAAPLPPGAAAGIAELTTGDEPAAGRLPGGDAPPAAGTPPVPLPQDDPAPAPAAATQSGGFDPADVPESAVALPPFPLLEAPAELQSAYRETERDIAGDGQYFLAGERALLVEGRIFRDKFHLGQDPERPWTAQRFHRHYEEAIAALGGRRIDRVQYTREVAAAAGGRATIEKHQHGAVAVPDYRHDSYLLRSGGREYWIDVSTGAIPLHGYVVVLERDSANAADAAQQDDGAAAETGAAAATQAG